MSTKKLSNEELQKLKDFQRKDNEIVFALGQLEVRLLFSEKRKSDLQKEYQVLIQNQDSLGRELQEKYGEGTIDVEKGEFVKTE
jgi:hypothetical protein